MDKRNHVLVFAGTGEVGIEICKKFLSKNFNLTFTSTSLKKIHEKKKKLTSVYKNSIIKGIYCDFLKKNSIKKIVGNFFKENSNNKIIINCCGIFGLDGIKKISQEQVEKFLRLNTFPTMIINQEICKIKKKNQRCNIYTLGSSSCYVGVERTISYCLSKHALLGLIKSLNKELNKKNVWNILVSTGTIKNKMGKKIKHLKKDTLIDMSDISETVFNLTKLNSSFTDEIWLKRLIP